MAEQNREKNDEKINCHKATCAEKQPEMTISVSFLPSNRNDFSENLRIQTI